MYVLTTNDRNWETLPRVRNLREGDSRRLRPDRSGAAILKGVNPRTRLATWVALEYVAPGRQRTGTATRAPRPRPDG